MSTVGQGSITAEGVPMQCLFDFARDFKAMAATLCMARTAWEMEQPCLVCGFDVDRATAMRVSQHATLEVPGCALMQSEVLNPSGG